MMTKNIGIYLTERDSKVFIETLNNSINEKLPEIETNIVYGQKTIYGLRTTIVFEYTKENLLSITSAMDANLKNTLSIIPL